MNPYEIAPQHEINEAVNVKNRLTGKTTSGNVIGIDIDNGDPAFGSGRKETYRVKLDSGKTVNVAEYTPSIHKFVN